MNLFFGSWERSARLTHCQEKYFAACHSGDSGSIFWLTQSPHPTGKSCADFWKCPGRFRAQAGTASAGSQYIWAWSLRPIGTFVPCQKSALAKLLEEQTTQGVEKSMLLKWKPPKIINGRDDDSL